MGSHVSIFGENLPNPDKIDNYILVPLKNVTIIPERSEGLLFYRRVNFHRVSVTHHERDHESDCARDKKAKDWVGTGQIWTVECLKTSKVHNLSVGPWSGE